MARSMQAVCLIPEMFNQATIPEITALAVWQHPSSHDATIMSPYSAAMGFNWRAWEEGQILLGFSIYSYQQREIAHLWHTHLSQIQMFLLKNFSAGELVETGGWKQCSGCTQAVTCVPAPSRSTAAQPWGTLRPRQSNGQSRKEPAELCPTTEGAQKDEAWEK